MTMRRLGLPAAAAALLAGCTTNHYHTTAAPGATASAPAASASAAGYVYEPRQLVGNTCGADAAAHVPRRVPFTRDTLGSLPVTQRIENETARTYTLMGTFVGDAGVQMATALTISGDGTGVLAVVFTDAAATARCELAATGVWGAP